MVFPDDTKNIILITKDNINNKKRSTNGSYLKYENAYINTKSAIVVVKKIKLNDMVSKRK